MIHNDADPSQRRGRFGMSQSNSGYLTEDAYVEYRWTQDEVIRKEFEKLHNLAETHYHELRGEMDIAKGDIKELKDDVRQLKVDVKQLQVDVKQLQVDVKGLKEDVRELKVDFHRMQGRMYNQSIRNLFIRVTPIGAYRPGSGLVEPDWFPKNAHEFWKLRTPRSSSQLEHLIYLVRFYDVQGYETWKYTDARTNSQKSESDDEESDAESGPDSESSQISLEEAVREYPHMAVEALAPIIGLVEADFDSFRAKAAQYRQRPQAPVAKRQPEPISREFAKREGKRFKQDSRSPGPVPEQRPSIPLHQLIASPKSKSSDPVSERTRLEWDNTSALEAIQRILDRAKQGRSQNSSPEVQAQGSTGAVSAVQSVLDQCQGRSLRHNSAEAFPGSPTELNASSPRVVEKSPSIEARG